MLSSDSVRIERPQCNQTLAALSSLREGVDYEGGLTTNYVLCVNLQPGAEYLDYSPIGINTVSVIITGNTGAVVKCSEASQLAMNDSTESPLVFNNSGLVVIERVQFEGCQRPLRFDWVDRVELISSRFR